MHIYRENPNKYLSIQIDGMDQSKTKLPRKAEYSKDFEEMAQVTMHLTGIYAGATAAIPLAVYLNTPAIASDPNLTVSVIHRYLMELQQVISVSPTHQWPEVFYVQMDNSGKDNKNWCVFSYLSMLVYRGVFRKV